MKRLPIRWVWGVVWGALAVQAQFTEVPTTAPMNGLLLEMDVIAVATDHRKIGNHGVKATSISVGSVLLSKGITERLDIQLGLELWHHETVETQGLTQIVSGRGDGWLRMKWNFSGDESEGPAWALIPYVKLPIADENLGNDHFEPGIALAFGKPLSKDVALNATWGWDVLDAGVGRHDHAIYASAALTRNFSERLAIYGELGASVEVEASQDWSAEIGAGVVFAFNDRGWFDLAVYTGLTDSSPDLTPVLRGGWQF